MSQKQMGDLPKHDPLYHYLKHEVLPQIVPNIRHPEFRVFKLHSTNNEVYLYEEKASTAKVVGKFFSSGEHSCFGKASQRAKQEFNNLVELRHYGFVGYPHQVVKPLAYNAGLNHLLVVEHAPGDSLGMVIKSALLEGKRDHLYKKLGDLAYFLAMMHNRTGNGFGVEFNRDCQYFAHLIEQLQKIKVLNSTDANAFLAQCEQWKEMPKMWEDQQVLVHGDATPSNFIFGKRHEVTAIDLERMKYADRIFDLGRVTGELQHFFWSAGKHHLDAEPFIGHFLWEYSSHFPNRSDTFRSITARLPFQIAINLLRIARNPWISYDYGRCLLREAKKTLVGF